ncbi:MAG: dockerin type I repeat-containing protein, partial [Bacteroidota bacterium]
NDNNCIYEYNEIHNCALKTSDTGATYGTLRWDSYGNIFRYNFIHHNRRANGFYCDDGNSGDFHYKNILHNCIDALKFGGGHDNIAEQNLLIQNSQQRIDDRGISRNYRLGTRHETNLQAMKPFEEPWLSYGAQLVSDHNLTTNLWSDVLNADWKPEYPNGCRYKDNVTVESDKWKIPANGEIIFEGNEEVGSIEAAGFYDFEGMDLRTDNAIILSKFPELNEVFPKMGLIANSCRPEVPKRITDNDGAATTDGEDELIDRTLIADLDKTEYKYDFGPAESITPEGWTLIRPDMIGSVYWSGEDVEGEDQEAGAAIDDLKRDFIKGNGTSQLNLKTRNGIWKVELVMGEMNVGLVGMRVKAEGEYIGYNVQTEPGEFKFLDGAAGSLIPSAVEVKVTDGELTLEIDADSPSHWTINHLRLVRVATETEVDLEARTYQYDFGAIDSETEEGWSVISPLDYGDINWTGGALSASDDVTATEISTLTRDLVQSSEEVSFNHKISNGIWRVELVMGEQGTNHWGMQVEAEGKLIAGNISTAAREFKYIEEGGASVEPTYFDIPVTDGELNISFNVLASRPWVANFLKLTKVADDVTVDMTKLKYQYDFGSFDSETLGGWQIITQDDFGDINWTGATLTPRDQGLEEGNTNLTRDYLEATGEVNFNHKIDNGKWRIELVMGNQNMDMTGIAISVEGEQLVSDMSVGAGEYKYADSEGGSLAPAYLEVIIQDGELNISINSASTWAINHLSLTKSGSEVKLPENISCYQYDFGPVGSKTEAGWRVISLGDYGDIFWSGQELASQDQGLGQGIDELTRDFVTSGGAVEFHHKISNGKWRVQLVMGEKNTNHWGMRVEAEGERIAWNFATDKGEFKYVGQGEASAEPAFFDVEVADEELNLVLSVGGSRPWVANHIKLIKLTTDEEGNDVPLTSEDTNCGCNGIFLDADEDGVCDSSDKCPLIDDALLGTACDDGDSCTVNDTYNVDCNCVGTILDEDKDGICAAEDCNDQDETIGRKQEAGTACDDGNPTTVNDVIQVDGCTCIGSQPKSLGVRMCLEGPYDPEIGLMSDSLRQKNLLPLEDPYGLGEFTNPALLENTGSDAIVDWVKVELRDKLDPSVIHATEAMLLQRDGNLITAEGDSLLTIGLSLDSVYLTVSHANHLSLTTETPVHLRDTLKLDFSLLETAIYGGKDAGKIVGDTRLLIAGDANGDGTVDEIDKIQLWRTQNGTSVSESSKAADFNLDGVINVVDRNEYLRVNNGAVERKP